MGSSYRETSEKYKNNKKKLIDGYNDTPYKKIKKNKKKNKRSKHKHEYIPALYYTKHNVMSGAHCKKCGRIQDLHYFFYNKEDKIKEFKKEYSNYIQIELPEEWKILDKYIPYF